MSDHADEELVGRLRAGDVDALAQFLTARQRPLLAFIERQLGAALRSKVEPDDLYQEVSAEAVRSLSGIELGDRDPFSWLCQIAERRIIDAHRRFFGAQKRSAAREVPLGAPVGGDQSRAALVDLLVMTMTTASQAFSRNQREIKLIDAMGQLNEEQREVLRLRYLEGLPSKEIASRMGKTDGAVRVMLSRSLDRLQTILGPDAAPR
ncbi:MAG: sigma-70 family RNA polymerase sigma factor [Pirellulales bacterium]|nr:sigma-70 family RNA polymerase sigma factor [Pirellulales bacterium]